MHSCSPLYLPTHPMRLLTVALINNSQGIHLDALDTLHCNPSFSSLGSSSTSSTSSRHHLHLNRDLNLATINPCSIASHSLPQVLDPPWSVVTHSRCPTTPFSFFFSFFSISAQIQRSQSHLHYADTLQSDIKRPSSPGSPTPGTGASSAFTVARPHGANAVR